MYSEAKSPKEKILSVLKKRGYSIALVILSSIGSFSLATGSILPKSSGTFFLDLAIVTWAGVILITLGRLWGISKERREMEKKFDETYPHGLLEKKLKE